MWTARSSSGAPVERGRERDEEHGEGAGRGEHVGRPDDAAVAGDGPAALHAARVDGGAQRDEHEREGVDHLSHRSG